MDIYQEAINFPFFKELPDSIIKILIRDATIVKAQANEVIMKENDIGDFFCVILRGQVFVTRSGITSETEHVISTLKVGESFGEMILFDEQRRSATIVASEDSTFIKITQHQVNDLSRLHPDYYAIFMKNCGKIITSRLKRSNSNTIDYLDEINLKNQLRVNASNFFIYTIMFMCFYALSLKLMDNKAIYINDIYMFLYVFIFAIGPIGLLIHFNHYRLDELGISFKNGLINAREAVLFTIPFLIGLLLIKWWMAQRYGYHLFGGVLFNDRYAMPFSTKLLLMTFYIAACPFQELISRGVLQGFLQKFIIGKYPVLQSIVISNIIFSTVHFYLSVKYGLIVFIPGLFWGYLYARQSTLVGPTISHMLIGVFFIYFLGIEGIIAK